MLFEPISAPVQSALRSAVGLRPGGIALPIPTNNQFAIFGDSRTSNSTENTGTEVPARLTSYGYGAWALHGCRYRGKLVGNYGVNANTLTNMQTRLTSVETRGQVLATPASVVVFLGGVNDATSPIGTTGPLYDSIITQLRDAGKIVVLLNEIPNTDQSTQGAVHLLRRGYLDAVVYSGNKVVKLNSYDLMALSPTSYNFKTGYITPPDLLHPNLNGNRVLGTAVGNILNALFTGAGFAPRDALATVVNDAAFAKATMFNGTTGSNGGGGASGLVADNWNADIPPTGLTVVYSKGTDPNGYEQQIVTVTGNSGTAGSIAGFDLSDFSLGGTFAVSGDTVQHGARVIIDSGNVGLVAVAVDIASSDNTNAVFQNASQFSGSVYNVRALEGGAWNGNAFDGLVLSQPLTLGAGWTASASKGIVTRIGLRFMAGQAVSATIRLSRSCVAKNR